jgi:hypothetical protein
MQYTPVSFHPRMRSLFILFDVLELGLQESVRMASAALPRRRRGWAARHPGPDTPVWNVFASEMRRTLRPRGAKVRLARYLGVPKQRVTKFFTSRTRIPDAELTLQILHWYVDMQQTGRDRTL